MCLQSVFHCIIVQFSRMPKNYSLGRNRYLAVKKMNGDLLVTIAEEGSDVKTVTFPSRRCVQFVKTIGKVDEAVINLLAKQYN